MKRFAALLLALALTVCGAAFGETQGKPDPDKTAYEALDILSALLMCPGLVSFEGAPEAELAMEAILAWRMIGDGDDLSNGEIYRLLFASGEYDPAFEGSDPNLLPVEIEIDSAIDSGDGTVKVSLTAYADSGDGYEFYLLADVYLLPDPEAPSGSRISRVFLPE